MKDRLAVLPGHRCCHTHTNVLWILLAVNLSILLAWLNLQQHLEDKVELHRLTFVSQKPKIKLWSTDFHISPIADLKNLLKDHDVEFIDKSLSSHCHLTGTCAKDLRVLDENNGIELSPCPNKLRAAFYDTYRNDPDFMSADAILCLHAISMCELYMPFNKPLILISSTR